MKFNTCLIIWHHKEPVFSVDFHESGRIATGGADNTVKIWRLSEDGTSVTFLSNLSRHKGAVNIVRFSPNGQYLASGSDDGTIYIWKLDPSKDPATHTTFGNDEDDRYNQEIWSVHTSLMEGGKDIYAIDWSIDSTELISGSIDCGVYIWSVTNGRKLQEFREHSHYVQGVLFDPLNQYSISQSQDKSVKVYKRKKNGGKFYCAHNIKKRYENDQNTNNNQDNNTNNETKTIQNVLNNDKTMKDSNLPKPFSHTMFLDETVSSFFRRPAWSTDGNYIFIPTGTFRKDKDSKPIYVTYVFNRNSFQTPIAYIPSKKPSLIVRFSPKLYKLKTYDDNSNNQYKFLNLSYRMIFAIATSNSIIVYDTQRLIPLTYLENIHYASITDLVWSKDGKILIMSSSDGYVSTLRFENDELGDEIEQSEYDNIMKNVFEAKNRQPKVSNNKQVTNKSTENNEKVTLQKEDKTPTKPNIRRITPFLVEKKEDQV